VSRVGSRIADRAGQDRGSGGFSGRANDSGKGDLRSARFFLGPRRDDPHLFIHRRNSKRATAVARLKMLPGKQIGKAGDKS
jgi:hypothetical protein